MKMEMKQLMLCAAVMGSLLGSGCIIEPEHSRGGAVVISDAPPPRRVEVVPVAPGPNHVWVEGYWQWNGRWVWAPGRYVSRPRPRARWEAGHWEHRGRRGWVWTEGRWR